MSNSLITIDEEKKMDTYKIEIGTFGDYLKEEWLEPLGLSSYKLAKDLGISATALGKILSGKHRMSMDTCWRLARYFGVSRNYFFNIQADIEERNNSDSFDSETKGLPVYNWG